MKDPVTRYDANMSSTVPEPSAPAEPTVVVTALPCTGCYGDAKTAVLAGAQGDAIPKPLAGVVMVNGALFCDVRHVVNFGPPSLLVAQPGQLAGLVR